MTIEELKKKVEEFRRANDGWDPDVDQLAEMIAPGLYGSKTPESEQLALFGESLGWCCGDGGWYKSAAGETVAAAIAQGCAHGLTVGLAAELVLSGYCVGINERGG